MTADSTPPVPQAADEVVDLCRDLIRINTTNTGDTTTAAGERAAAEYVAAKLSEVGLEPRIYESAKGRASVVARFEGADPTRPALLLHGHLDVVPADPSEWSIDPFSGEVKDGYVWGRGAVDMKDFDAMLLAVVRQWKREGRVPPRDFVLMFLADEEAAGRYGAHFLVDEHPDEFDGVSEAVGEVGGFSVTVNNDLRLYMIETAEKGLDWLRLTVTDRPGHGSMIHPDNAVTRLSEAVAKVGRHRFPVELTPTVRAFLEEVSEVLQIDVNMDDPEEAIAKLGPIARIIGATIRHTANPTGLTAGYKENVIPGKAEAVIDCRPLPERSDEMLAQLREVIGDGIDIEHIHRQPGLETTFDGPLIDAMSESLRHFDSAAHPVPYMLSGGTDAKAFQRLGIRCFGFAPLQLPADLDFSALFHGIDERVPVDALRFGARVLDRFLTNS